MTSPGKLDPTDPDAFIPAHVIADMQHVEVPKELLAKFDELKDAFIQAGVDGWERRERPTPETFPVYIGIGNSDDKLIQLEWAEFVQDMKALLDANAVVRGEWFSASDSMYQNACWWVETTNPHGLQAGLQDLCRLYRQEAIAWTPVQETLFIKQDSLIPLN